MAHSYVGALGSLCLLSAGSYNASVAVGVSAKESSCAHVSACASLTISQESALSVSVSVSVCISVSLAFFKATYTHPLKTHKHKCKTQEQMTDTHNNDRYTQQRQTDTRDRSPKSRVPSLVSKEPRARFSHALSIVSHQLSLSLSLSEDRALT